MTTNSVTLFLNHDSESNGFLIVSENKKNHGYLPDYSTLITAYDNWSQNLYEFEQYSSKINTEYSQSTPNKTNSPLDDFKEMCDEEDNEYTQKKQIYAESEQNLIQQMNQWLKQLSSNGILNILEKALKNSDKLWIRFITDNLEIAKLPWECWVWIQTKKKNGKEITVTFSPLNLSVSKLALNKKINVLLIFGALENKAIQEQEEKLWQNLDGINKLEVLKDTTATGDNIYQEIRNHNYDIVYLSGHSRTNQHNIGEFYLDKSEPLEASNLIKNLQTKKELKLIIFNSCDSLGFAFELYKHDLAIPNIIAMRYIIHNQTSVFFLQELINLFIEQGKPLHEVLQLIRDSLKDNQDKYAAGSYLLPVLFQLSPQPQLWKNWFSPLPSVIEFSLISGYSFAITVLIIFLRTLGLLESVELLAYDQLMRFRPNEKPDDRILVVVAKPEDINNQTVKPQAKTTLSGGTELPSLSDDTLKRVLEKLNQYHPTAIGLDIYQDYTDVSPELKYYLQQDHVFGVCKKPFDKSGIKASPEIKEANVGFTDAIEDNDSTLRRHILTSSPEDSDCPVIYNLSLKLAEYYLEKQKNIIIKTDYPNSCKFSFNQAKFVALNIFSENHNNFNIIAKILQNNQGGYHNEDLIGCQIMLNYRKVNSSVEVVGEMVTLTQVLKGEVDQSKIKNPIIIVGIARDQTESNNNDYWKTPYSRNEIAGVFIQAQMVSQILSAALDGRSLIKPLFFWQEFLVIWLCSLSSGLITYIFTKKRTFTIILFLEILLCLSSYGLLIIGLWLPLIPSGLVIILTPVVVWIGGIDFKELAKRFDNHLVREVNL